MFDVVAKRQGEHWAPPPVRTQERSSCVRTVKCMSSGGGFCTYFHFYISVKFLYFVHIWNIARHCLYTMLGTDYFLLISNIILKISSSICMSFFIISCLVISILSGLGLSVESSHKSVRYSVKFLEIFEFLSINE